MKPTVVVGGQAGSEGKGAVCAYLHRHDKYDMAIRVGGPNAGHTVVDDEGRRWALRQLPVAAIADRECALVIAAGSEVDLAVLTQEMRQTQAAGFETAGRVFLDETASLIDSAAIVMEQTISTGTTGKGIGGVRAQRALRGAMLVSDLHDHAFADAVVCDTQVMVRAACNRRVMLEGTQGYILGTHAGEYPFATSGDCRAIDFMAAAGMSPQEADVVVVLRMHPIRIAGNSGPLTYETTWEALGIAPEQTTVTKKTRRVGHWDHSWAERSIAANGGDVQVALTFVDYDFPHLAGLFGPTDFHALPNQLQASILFLEETGCRVQWLGTGPQTMIDLVR